ncbi:DUF5994 family protein [Streptomyces hydrogenans]|uniref:DUF5994 family protein n=1 Tax=Streptomyces hydrogenans TaxID=1873719 RepID=UPI0035DD221F
MTTALIPSPPVRLTMTPKATSDGLLDGAWWPRSRDLASELPALAVALDDQYGPITRITVNPSHWPSMPRKVPVPEHTGHAGHTVRVGWFADQDPDKLILISSSLGRCDLLVIPPGTEPGAAARLMTAASLRGSPLAAGALVPDETTTGHRTRDAGIAEDAWETDGGSAPPPTHHPVVGARMIPLPGNPRR